MTKTRPRGAWLLLLCVRAWLLVCNADLFASQTTRLRALVCFANSSAAQTRALRALLLLHTNTLCMHWC